MFCDCVRVGVVTDPPQQESVSDPLTLLDALKEPVTEPLSLTTDHDDASVFFHLVTRFYTYRVSQKEVAPLDLFKYNRL